MTGRPMNEGIEPTDTMHEADALEVLEYDTNVALAYLRNYAFNHPDRDLEATVEAVEDLLRARAMPLIRALREQVKQAESSVAVIASCSQQVAEFRTRIESLEAERDIWQERATKGSQQGAKPPHVWSFVDTTPPTPFEIAARVEQNRKERSLVGVRVEEAKQG